MLQGRFRHPVCLLAPLIFCCGLLEAQSTAELKSKFANPPDDARILMRWWWFGAAVTHAEIERELKIMKSVGIGGVEIQPVYALELDDPDRGIRNLPYLSPEFLDALQFAAKTAGSLGIRVDVTLGSGWPYGGPNTLVTEAAGKLRFEQMNVPEGIRSIPLPGIENGEKVIGAFLGSQLVQPNANGTIDIPPGLSGSDLLLMFVSSRTGQQVKRPAIGAEGFVLNHYDRSAVQHHLTEVGEKLVGAFGTTPPYSVFSDSLEVFGSDWTANFLAEFKSRRGYDLMPHLPALVTEMGEETEAVRHDWAKTLTELAEDNYLKPIREWAHAHHTLFRSQTYGEPPVILSSAQFVDLPEGEHGPYWRRFSDARWASSACHIYKKPVVSTETWTWLHSPAFRATPLDLKAEADRHFLEGINQLVGHGWPYSPPQAGEPGWRFYASGALNDHNPWFNVMPDLAHYLQRISFLMRQGAPANDIAIYLPTDDAWARLKPGSVAFDEMIDSLLGPTLMPQILNAGYNFDFIDDRMIATAGIPYKVVILPGIERIPLSTLQRFSSYAQAGGNLIATRTFPLHATGLLEQKTETARIVALSNHLFQGNTKGAKFLEDEVDLGATLAEVLAPDLSAGDAAPAIGFVHRKVSDKDIYFVANTSNRPAAADATFRVSGRRAEWWSPMNGETKEAECREIAGRTGIRLDLAPYESRLLVFGERGACSAPVKQGASPNAVQDISSDWKVSFSGTGKPKPMQHLHSWTDDEATRFYSGEAVYEKTFTIDNRLFQGGTLILDFGQGRPVEPSLAPTNGMSALLDSPVREAAVVYVNGKRAGSVWCPPYELDITRFLQSGENTLRIVVANLAINEMAGKALPDYRLLNERYGERFVPQDMQNLRPIPSGIFGPVRVLAK